MYKPKAVTEFEQQHGPDSVSVGRSVWFKDGTHYEMTHDRITTFYVPDDPIVILKNIVFYHRASLDQAERRFYDLKENLKQKGDASDEDIEQLRKLQHEVQQCRAQLSQAENELNNANPELDKLMRQLANSREKYRLAVEEHEDYVSYLNARSTEEQKDIARRLASRATRFEQELRATVLGVYRHGGEVPGDLQHYITEVRTRREQSRTSAKTSRRRIKQIEVINIDD